MSFHTRLYLLQKTLQNEGCDALLIEDLTNLYYLTGLELSAGKLLVHSKGGELFVDGRYIESAKKHSPFPVHLVEQDAYGPIFAFPEFSSVQKLGFDSETVTYSAYTLINKMREQAASKGHLFELVPLEGPLKRQRAIKDQSEVQALREAAALGSQGYDFLCRLLKEGISEQECALELDIFWKRLGSKGVGFEPIVAFGANSSMPHHRAGKDLLSSGQCVLIDIGVNFKHYHSDMTRVVFFGKPDTRLVAIHSIVQKAQQAALAICRPGTTLGQLDQAARHVIAEHGYAEQFTHSLGHGIGLDIHEYPRIKNTPQLGNVPLAKGMAITIEPGIYLPGIGGIRIEDSVIITEDSHENLTLRNTDPVFIER